MRAYAYSITVFYCLYNYIHDFFVLQLKIMSTAELLITLISQLTAGQRPQQLAEGAKRTPMNNCKPQRGM